MSITIDHQQLQQKQLKAIKKKKRRNAITSKTATKQTMLEATRYYNDQNQHQNNNQLRPTVQQRSPSMLSLHGGCIPKKISPDDFNTSWIPSEVKIYPTNTRIIKTTINSKTTTTMATNTCTLPTTTTNDYINKNHNHNHNNNKTILVVVGVPDNFENNELSTTRSNPKKCGSLYSHTQFLYFQQNLLKTIQICRGNKNNNTSIIHISNSSSSGLGLPKTEVTKQNLSRPQNQKDNEIFISKPIWSTSGNILLLDALEKLSNNTSSSQQQQQQQQQHHNNNNNVVKTTRTNTTTTVLVCGLVTSVCVLHSAMVCSEAGYKTYLIEDSCADRDRIRHDHAISLAQDSQKVEIISTIIPSSLPLLSLPRLSLPTLSLPTLSSPSPSSSVLLPSMTKSNSSNNSSGERIRNRRSLTSL
jgi:hypothetical protein